MPLNILILPLLGGFLFIHTWNKTSAQVRTYSGNRLLFFAALSGACFLAIAYVAAQVLSLVVPQLWVYGWVAFLPKIDYLTSSLSTLPLAYVSARLLNLCPAYRVHTVAEADVLTFGTELDLLVHDVWKHKKLLQVTLKSRKVYIGQCLQGAKPHEETPYLKLLPFFSGHRDSERLNLCLDRDYISAYAKLAHSSNTYRALGVSAYLSEGGGERFAILIPVPEILSASRFERSFYEELSGAGRAHAAAAPDATPGD